MLNYLLYFARGLLRALQRSTGSALLHLESVNEAIDDVGLRDGLHARLLFKLLDGVGDHHGDLLVLVVGDLDLLGGLRLLLSLLHWLVLRLLTLSIVLLKKRKLEKVFYLQIGRSIGYRSVATGLRPASKQ